MRLELGGEGTVPCRSPSQPPSKPHKKGSTAELDYQLQKGPPRTDQTGNLSMQGMMDMGQLTECADHNPQAKADFGLEKRYT